MRKLTFVLSVLFVLSGSASLSAAPSPTPSPTPASPTPTASPNTTYVETEAVNVSTLSQAAPATTGVMSVTLTGPIFTITPTGACTFNSTGTSRIGKECTFVITTSGTTSRVLTFGTNFIAAGTLSTGTVTAKRFAITFRCLDGTTWIELDRTGAM